MFMQIFNAVDWNLIAVIVGSGAFVAWVTEIIKRNKSIDNSATLQFISGAFAWISAQLEHIIKNPDVIVTVPAKYAAFVWISSQVVYQVSKLAAILFRKVAERRALKNVPAASGDFV